MEFIVDTTKFANIAKIVIKGLDLKDEASQALLKIEKDNLIIQCTSQTTCFRGEVPISHVEKETDEVTEWSVDGKQLITILSILPTFPMDAKFTMSSSNRQFNITTKNGKFKLPVNDNVINYEMEDLTELSEIDSTEFIKNFSKTSKFLENDSMAANAMSCLHMYFGEDLKMMGLNGYSLIEISMPYDLKVDLNEAPTVLLRSNQLNLLANSFEPNTTLTLLESNNFFGYKDNNNVIALVAKADMTPISYEVFKARVSNEQSITFDSNSLKFATNSMFKLCPTSDLIHYEISDKETLAVNDNEDDMKLTVIDKKSKDITLTFAKRVLLPVFNVINENVQFTWAEEDPDIVKVNVLKDDDDTIDENVFIIITLHAE